MAGSRTQARGFQPIPSVTEKCYSVRLFRRNGSPIVPPDPDRFRPVRDKMWQGPRTGLSRAANSSASWPGPLPHHGVTWNPGRCFFGQEILNDGRTDRRGPLVGPISSEELSLRGGSPPLRSGSCLRPFT